MHLLPASEMKSKLSESWAFLSGANLEFKESTRCTFNPSDSLMALILPVQVDNELDGDSIAIGLIMDDDEAVKVASHMFGLMPEVLSKADIEDAKRESCNILGGGLIVEEGYTLGLPKEITLDTFFELQKKATFSKLYVSDKPNEDRVNLVIFDVKNMSEDFVA